MRVVRNGRRVSRVRRTGVPKPMVMIMMLLKVSGMSVARGTL